jgi:uncharacterized protein (TIGR03435 family)
MLLNSLALLLAAAAVAQSASPPFTEFEVATIRPNKPEAARYIRMQSAHQFQAKNYTVNGLITAAYDLTPKAVSGGPAWADSDRYEIIAVTPGDQRPTYNDQMTMLRALLKDRFNLSFHREKKEFPVYELTVSKTGSRLTESQSHPDESPRLIATVYPASSGGIDKVVLPARNATMPQFASTLQRAVLDRTVVDRTGLTARYDFDLEWTPDETQFGGNLPPGPPDSGKPGLFAALQQQLGLRIEAAKGPVETLVIDRVDRPTAN